MRVFKNLDYFRKVAPEHTKPTVIGGLVSICSLSVILMLFCYEINDYLKLNIKKDTYIGALDRQPGVDVEFINMNLDITFPHVPCFMIDVDQRSTVSQSDKEEINKNIFRRRIGADGQVLDSVTPDFNNPSVVVKDLADALISGESCNIKGRIKLERVTGQIIMNFQNRVGFVQELQRSKPDVAAKLSFGHVINSLTFGEPHQQNAIKKRFGNTDHTQFDMMDFVEDSLYENDKGSRDYFYFFKLVPHVFIDEINLEQYQSFSYSLNHNSKASQVQNFPQITMIYDFAPVNMKITKQQRDLSRFLVNVSQYDLFISYMQLCAIIGGIFVIFGLINRLLLSVKESFSGDNR
eukprot:403372594